MTCLTPEPPNTNLFLLVMIPFFIGSSEMSRCRGLPRYAVAQLDAERTGRGFIVGFLREETDRGLDERVERFSSAGKSPALPGIRRPVERGGSPRCCGAGGTPSERAGCPHHCGYAGAPARRPTRPAR